MNFRSLGNTDLEVSPIGLGCVTFGREINQATSFEILDHAIAAGINLLDTAAVYSAGGSETVLGEWISSRGLRDSVVLATKVNGRLSKQQIMASAEASLDRLRTDRIDLFQLHGWDERTPIDETLAALELLIRQGKIRFAGCSNWSASQLGRALSMADNDSELAGLSTVQPPYNLVQREIEAELLPLCEDRQVGVLSYSPLAAGFLVGKYVRGGAVPEGTRFDVMPGHQSIYFNDENFEIVENLRQVAELSGRTMIELALAWVLKRQGPTTVLVGARTAAHVDQAFSAMELSRKPSLSRWLDSL